VAIALGKLIAVMLVVPISFYFFRNYKMGAFRKDIARKYLTFTLPIIIISITTKLQTNLDKVILQFFSDSTHVGYYTAGFRFAGFIKMLAAMSGGVLMPDFSRAFAKGDHTEITSKVSKYERFGFIFILPFVILIAIESDIIIPFLLGNEFDNSIPVFMLTSFGLFFHLIGMPFGNVITGKGKFKIAALINVICFLIFLMGAYFLVNPKFFGLGEYGMAWTIFLLYGSLMILYMIISGKYIRFDYRNLLMYILYGIGIFGIGYGFYTRFINDWVHNILFSIGFLLLYFIGLKLFNLIKKRDIELLKNILNLKKLFNYTKDELSNNK
jgi:O-antigen/teichoic acid export membrane protein